jgi:hypothetical protein
MIGKKTTVSIRKPMKRAFRRIVNAIQWKTINVVPLPGIYANRYRMRDGRMLLDPCPAILVQSRGGETRAVFATFEKGHLFPAVDTAGYEESSTAGGSRPNPHRADRPPWKLLEEEDPATKVAKEIAASTPLAQTWVENGAAMKHRKAN